MIENIGWVVAIEPADRFRVTVEGLSTDVYLSSSADAVTWSATETVDVGGNPHAVSFTPDGPSGLPLLTLTAPGGKVHRSAASGGGPNYVRFAFGHRKVCPGAARRGPSPCDNLLIVRLDWAGTE